MYVDAIVDFIRLVDVQNTQSAIKQPDTRVLRTFQRYVRVQIILANVRRVSNTYIVSLSIITFVKYYYTLNDCMYLYLTRNSIFKRIRSVNVWII